MARPKNAKVKRSRKPPRSAFEGCRRLQKPEIPSLCARSLLRRCIYPQLYSLDVSRVGLEATLKLIQGISLVVSIRSKLIGSRKPKQESNQRRWCRGIVFSPGALFELLLPTAAVTGLNPPNFLVRHGRKYMGVSENRGPQYSTLNNRILIIRTPNKVPLIFGNSHMGESEETRTRGL